MIIYDQNKYKQLFSEEYIKKIEKENNIKIYFVALKGKQIWGYSNAVSNYDFYALYEGVDCSKKHFTIKNKERNFNFKLYDLDYVIKTAKKYNDSLTKYPSILSRDEQSDLFVQNQNFEERADATSSILFEVMYSDYIVDSGYLAENLNQLLGDIFYIGLLDYYYSKAYGCLNNIFIKDEFKGIKYLETFLGISCMKWLLEKRTVPEMDIYKMMERYCPDYNTLFLKDIIITQEKIARKVRDEYIDVKDIDATVKAGTKITVKRNDEFNCWVEYELLKIADLIKSMDKNIKISLGNDVMLAKWINR